MPTIKQGSGVLVPALTNVKEDVQRMLVKLDPMRTPLLNWLILSNKRSKVVTSAYGKYEWYRRSFVPHAFTVGSSAITPSSSQWSLTSSSFSALGTEFVGVVQPNDLVLAYLNTSPASYQVLRVVSNDGSTVVLGLADPSQQASAGTANIIASSTIRTMGQLLYDGHGRLNYVSVVEDQIYNFLKEFVYYVETTGRQQAGEYWTDGMTHAERVAQKFIEAKLEVERYLWFATLRSSMSSGNTQATLGTGLDGQILTAYTYTGSMTETAFRSILKSAFQYGSGKKIIYAGADLMNNIETFMQDKYRVFESDTSKFYGQFGIVANSFATFGGIATLVWNPLFDNDRTWNGYILDEEHVILRYMADDERGSRKMRVRDDVGIGYEDKRVTEILFDVGIQVNDQRTCGRIVKT